MEWAAILRDLVIGLLLAAALIVRFTRTGGVPMLRMMGGPRAGRERQPPP